MSDNLRITLIGPLLSLHAKYGHRCDLYTNSYAGYLKYQDNSRNVAVREISGHTFGIGSDFGLEIELAENFFFNLQASLTGGVLRNYEVNTGLNTSKVMLPKNRYENLYRADLLIGIKFK